jgi:acyl-CoA thioesterase-1
VRAAGVSGDTSGGGWRGSISASRRTPPSASWPWAATTCCRGSSPAVTKANLRGILQKPAKRADRVVLVGVGAPPLIGATYAKEFNAVYPALAREFSDPALPQHPGRRRRFATTFL